MFFVSYVNMIILTLEIQLTCGGSTWKKAISTNFVKLKKKQKR